MSKAAEDQLLEAARQRLREKGRRGLRRTPPRPMRPEREVRQYTAALRRIAKAIEEQVRARVFPEIDSLFKEAGTREDATRADDWGARLADLFAATRSSVEPELDEAMRAMESIGDEVQGKATEEQIKAIRATMGVRPSFYDDDQVRGILNTWKRQNGAFITRMADESVQEMMDTASRAVRSGRSNRDLRKDLRKRFGVTERRARTIARTEVSQLNAQITRERQKEVGIESFIWITAGDGRVRDRHEEWGGREFEWDSPPEGIMPGDEVNCRCIARPAVDRLLDKLEAE